MSLCRDPLPSSPLLFLDSSWWEGSLCLSSYIPDTRMHRSTEAEGSALAAWGDRHPLWDGMWLF